MNIKVRLFSHAKYRLNTDALTFHVSDKITVADLKLRIRKHHGSKLSDIPFRVAVNYSFVEDDYILCDADEIALIPPVQGG